MLVSYLKMRIWIWLQPISLKEAFLIGELRPSINYKIFLCDLIDGLFCGLSHVFIFCGVLDHFTSLSLFFPFFVIEFFKKCLVNNHSIISTVLSMKF